MTTFTYDANRQRVKTVEPAGKTTYFPFPGYSEEMVGTTVTARRVTYTIAGQAVASRVQTFSPAGNTLYRLYTNHLGSTVTHSTLTGGTVGGTNTTYLPYGSYRGTPPTQTLTDRDFTGQRENRELGLLYYNARFYVPSIGRFASPDTIAPDPANPQSFNRYTYSLNSPLNLIDPSGHCITEGLPDESFRRSANDSDCWQSYDNFVEFMSSQPDWYIEYYGWDAQKWYQAERFNQKHLDFLLSFHQKQSTLPRSCNGGGGNCSMAKWHQKQEQIASEVAPNAGIIGASGSAGFVDSYTAGIELIFNLDELALFFYEGTGWNLPTPEISVEPYYTGVIWNLENLEDYSGDFWALSIYVNTGAGAELTIFGAPGAIPFSSTHEGTWGVAVKPSSGIGVGGSFHQTVYAPLDPLARFRH